MKSLIIGSFSLPWTCDPGQTLNFGDLEIAKLKLKNLGFFDTSPECEPSVAVIDEPSALDDDGVFKEHVWCGLDSYR